MYDKDEAVTASSHLRVIEKLSNVIGNEITLESYIKKRNG